MVDFFSSQLHPVPEIEAHCPVGPVQILRRPIQKGSRDPLGVTGGVFNKGKKNNSSSALSLSQIPIFPTQLLLLEP